VRARVSPARCCSRGAMAVAAALCATMPLCAALPAHAAPSSAQSYVFAFEDADIAQVVREVLGATGTAYVLDPGVSGRVTFRIEQRLTRGQLLTAFEAVLAQNGFAMIREGDQMLITPQASAKSSASIRRNSERSGPGAGYELVAVSLAYAQPSEVAKALEAVTGASTTVYSNDKQGLLLLGGSSAQVRAALDAIKVFDQSAFEDSKIRWFELNQAQAVTVANELERIAQGAGLAGVSIVPLKRLNGVIIFGRSAEALAELSRWVARLDTPGKEAASTLWVYRPRNTSAEDLARTLDVLSGGQRPGDFTPSPQTRTGAQQASETATAPSSVTIGVGDDAMRVGVDKASNALIIFAPPTRWVQVQRILNEIDRPPRQILIEASIVEVTLGKDFALGIDWRSLSKYTTVSSIGNGRGIVDAQYPGFSITYLDDDIQAAVNALGARTSVEVVSAPKIIVLDNHPAKLEVGDQVPVVVQSQQSTAAANSALINTIDYRETGVILNVTPRIAGEDQVSLEVAQEASSVARTITSGIDSPTIQQRKFTSTLMVQDGGVVALGGLISSNKTVGRTGVPVLKEAPVIGALFRSDSRNLSRTELVVFLKARILRDQSASNAALADLAKDMSELQSRGLIPAR